MVVEFQICQKRFEWRLQTRKIGPNIHSRVDKTNFFSKFLFFKVSLFQSFSFSKFLEVFLRFFDSRVWGERERQREGVIMMGFERLRGLFVGLCFLIFLFECEGVGVSFAPKNSRMCKFSRRTNLTAPSLFLFSFFLCFLSFIFFSFLFFSFLYVFFYFYFYFFF